jgi:S-DNA-T family DNA segregation ATPase FtsK/SpoIIIE
MGPHGLVVGATGSGKSELLRTLVTTLAISHPPEALALLLADFKGGATFSGFAALPHIAGMVTNLEADFGLIDRFRDALAGELQRRQELLAAAGKVSSLDAYQQLQGRRPDLPALPRLLVIVDEFSELLGAKPDLAELFVTIGRIGRSIGIHLLLATQRLDTGRIRGLESHLSYRICLRTFSEAESREAIGSPAAYRLPAEPGWAYLVADTAEPIRFRASTVSRPYHPARPPRASTTARILPFLVENEVAQRISFLASKAAIDAGGGLTSSGTTWGQQQRGSILDVVVDRLTAGAPAHPRGRAVRPVWLEPLPAQLELGALLAPTGPADGLAAPMGLVDIPERQRQDVFCWNFDSGNGNLLIVGTGRSGKSAAVGTLLCSLASCYEPGDIAVLCVDFGGESLVAYRELPHVAAVATRSNPELIRLVFSRLRSILDQREALFGKHRLNSTAALRRARRAQMIDQAVPGAVVLIVDGWSGLRDADPSAESALDEILVRGPGLGVHTVMTIGAAGQLRTRLAAGFGGRIELRLGDSFDSAIDRRLSKALPADRPGRALVEGSHYAQIALPQANGSQQELVDKIQQRWPGPGVPRIQTLPAVISLVDIQRRIPTWRSRVGRSTRNDQLVLGVTESTMTPVQHSLSQSNPHLLIYGDTGSGKTTMLRSMLSQLTSTRPDGRGENIPNYPDGTAVSATAGGAGAADRSAAESGSAVSDGSATVRGSVSGRPSLEQIGAADSSNPATDELLAVDYRRGLPTGAANYQRFTKPSEASALCAALSSVLSERLAAAPARADGNSEIYLFVDDYELLGSASGNPLNSLLPFLPHARDIGFHLVLARRSGGAARAQYEPLLQALGDLGTPLLLLSGASTEGRLGHGLVPQQFPPGRAQFAMRGNPPRIIQIGYPDTDLQ